MTEFDSALVATPDPDDASRYAVDIGEGWQIGSGVNGGLLLAVVGNALRSAFAGVGGHQDPLTISAYYLSAARPGAGAVRTEVLRTGRTMTTGQASLTQVEDGAEVERLRALATYGDLGRLTDEVRTTATPPELPPPEECVSAAEAPPGFLKQAQLLQRLDLRLDPACVGWVVGQPSGRGMLQGWLRMSDPREPDPLLLLLAADALPPVTFDLGLGGWTPTLELTVHVRASPAPGWLAVRHSTRNLAGGLLEEDAEVWDSAGRLVAQSRQLARAPHARAAQGSKRDRGIAKT